jgi:hypothetical protein
MTTTNPWGSKRAGGVAAPAPQQVAEKPGLLKVKVTCSDAPRNAVEGAKVRVEGIRPAAGSREQTTPKSGLLGFRDLKPGSYNVTFMKKGWETFKSTASIASSRTTELSLVVTPAKQLVLQMYEHLGDDHPSVDYELWIAGKKVYKQDDFTGKVVIPFTDKKGNRTIDHEGLTEASLIVQVNCGGAKNGRPQKIKLHIGDPVELAGDDGQLDVAGLQKVLTNLGYQPGAVDGSWGSQSRAGLRAFQADHGLTVTGIPDSKTIDKLKSAFENPLNTVKSCPRESDMDPVFSPNGSDPDLQPAVEGDERLKPDKSQWNHYYKGSLWPQHEGYIDRAAPFWSNPGANKDGYWIQKGDQTGLKLFDVTRGTEPEDAAFGGVVLESAQKQRFFPTDAYVAITNKDDDSVVNPIWMIKFRSIILDCGGWVPGSKLDFAVIL